MQAICTSLQTDNHTNTSSQTKQQCQSAVVIWCENEYDIPETSYSLMQEKLSKCSCCSLVMTFCRYLILRCCGDMYTSRSHPIIIRLHCYACHNISIAWHLPSVLWHCWLGITKSIRPVKIEWCVSVVICLERGADCLHVVQHSSWCHCIPKPYHLLPF